MVLNCIQFPWNKSKYVAAINQEQFDGSGGTWCGGACGKCYKLTATGMYLNGSCYPVHTWILRLFAGSNNNTI